MSLSAHLGLNLSVSHVTLGKSLLSRSPLLIYRQGRDSATAVNTVGWIQSGMWPREKQTIWSWSLSLTPHPHPTNTHTHTHNAMLGPPSEADV